MADSRTANHTDPDLGEPRPGLVDVREAALRPAPPQEVREAAERLVYRNLVLVLLVVARSNVTEDLMDDGFEITVVMPGRLVAANSTGREGQREVTWEFNGSEFFDTDVVLMATSMVPHGAPEPEAETEAEVETPSGAEIEEEADR